MAGQSLQDAIKYLKKQVTGAFEFDDKREVLSTGSLAVDKAIGIGGFPRGRISEVFGWESSGKTTLCLSACKKAQQAGHFCAYIDIERGVDLIHAEKIGFNWRDETKGLYSMPRSMEECFTIINTLASTGKCPLVIADSIPAMVPQKELEGEIDEVAGGIGLRSRLLASFLARITKTLEETNTALVLCNQMRARIATDRFDYGPKEQAAGGSALKFYTSLRIDVHRGKEVIAKRSNLVTGEEIETTIGNIHKVHIVKNKMAMPFRETTFYIMFDKEKDFYGIDNLRTILDEAKESGIVQSKGAGYFTIKLEGTDVSLRGTEELYEWFLKAENRVAFDSIKKRLGY